MAFCTAAAFATMRMLDVEPARVHGHAFVQHVLPAGVFYAVALLLAHGACAHLTALFPHAPAALLHVLVYAPVRAHVCMPVFVAPI